MGRVTNEQIYKELQGVKEEITDIKVLAVLENRQEQDSFNWERLIGIGSAIL